MGGLDRAPQSPQRVPHGVSMKRLSLPMLLFLLLVPASATTQDVGEKKVLDNDRVAVYEFVFPPGFKGEEHGAVADEFAYVLDGEFTVVTQGKGKQVFRRGEIEYAARRTVHYSLNESKKPARVLVVLLKER
ncbi:MAG: hypothetical protein DMD84_02925 [Candidatus Rokuibacteriota bacterium]|nr:MAG: hypothetical protein DME13_15940 [Candidatus Rokubacteria bacterium]PYO54347.1 MAG: hypothetical protein DMD84_02925 [Candidatus Rokubacteria bacterium]